MPVVRRRTAQTDFAAVAVLAATSLLAAGCAGTDEPKATDGPGPAVSSAVAADRSTPPPGALREELDFTTATLEGKAFEGASLAGKDAVLWFWTPWCGTCRAEAPTIARTAAKWGDRVTFVGVPGKARTAQMKQFVTNTGLGGIVHAVDTDGSLWFRFGVAAQPAVAFLNDSGKIEIVPGTIGATELGDRVERLTLK
ncbi:TlpA family protein disulfide reductase [Streptomyces gobiensis]|uniref:TlpA family protein disulfide reductase n=1 Tax=Streptomyces gobiensis TaxID=2875706 RepID=UPI001E35846A|nr:redoxin family protein [Streptomyces gobiensis]UGY94769.1 redoxin family protein [Streptomyces gobiensis]